MYNGSVASPSWYAFDVDDEQMTETMLAEHAVDTLRNLSTHALPAPFFVAVGFHKPRKRNGLPTTVGGDTRRADGHPVRETEQPPFLLRWSPAKVADRGCRERKSLVGEYLGVLFGGTTLDVASGDGDRIRREAVDGRCVGGGRATCGDDERE